MVTFWQDVLQIWQTYAPSFLYGLKNTILIALVGTLCGLLIGILIGIIRALELKEIHNSFLKVLMKLAQLVSYLYIEVFRGTPMMVQAIFIYYALRPTLNWSPLVAGMVIISINTGAYMAEIIRGGLQAVDQGQKEAARSLGLNYFQMMFAIILPQAIRNVFPSIGNELIVNIKDSSVLNVISVTELFFQSNSIAGSVFKFKETFIITAIIYLCLTMLCSHLLNLLEKRLQYQPHSYPYSDTSSVHLG